MPNPTRRHFLRSLAMIPAVMLWPPVAKAHNETGSVSAASGLSLSLPFAVLAAAPLMFLSAGVALTVVAVEASATGTVWLLQRASDGVTASIRFSGEAAGISAIGVGTMISVTAITAGWLLSAAGDALCLVPNAIGESLLYSERIR